MLLELHIQNYAVIENLCIEFHPGLNLLSGETGSGKSILIDGLGLALGARASPDVIRTGQERATVTAVFHAEGRPPWAEWLEEYGLSGEAESDVILRREIHSSGKTRLLVNDQPATLAAVKLLAPLLVEVHGQSEQVVLFEPAAQLDLLDQFSGPEKTLQKVSELYSRRRAFEREMESLTSNEQERLRTLDLLRFQVQELDRAELQSGEDTRLGEEKRILTNLEKIRAAASSAYAHLYEDEASAYSKLARVSKALDELRRYDSVLDAYLEPLETTRATLEDLAFALRDYLPKLETNPRRLEEVEDRLALIDRLKRKYGNSIEEILAYCEAARSRLSNLEHADERRDQVQHELEKVVAEYRRAASQLSERRRAAAERLEKLVRRELAQVGMEKTRFQAHLKRLPEDQGGPKGIDEVELRISPNPGEELRPLGKIASGGELSRLVLALKTVVGQARSGGTTGAARRVAPTFIFDEIDAGIGGRVAEAVGQRLKRLAFKGQVLCVTHLAQIACFADHHFVVEKFERDGRTVTALKYLRSAQERAQELARMLSGRQITEAVLKHAAVMLRHASTGQGVGTGE